MVIVWSLATLASGLASRFAHLILARFVTGIGESGYVPGSSTWISLIFSKENRGKVLGIYAMAPPIGVTLGVVLGGHIATVYGSWRAPFFVFAVPGILLAIVTLFLPDYATVKERGEKTFTSSYFREVGSLLKIKTLLLHWIGVAMTTFLMFGLIAWYPTLLIRAYEMNAAEAGKIVGLAMIVGLISGPLSGFLADFSQRRNKRGRLLYLGTLLILISISKFSLFYTMECRLN
jgi:MFS family permease